MRSQLYIPTAFIFVLLFFGCSHTPTQTSSSTQGTETDLESPAQRLTLFFGREIQNKADVTELQFLEFVDKNITPHVSGLTITQGQGRYLLPDDKVVAEDTFILTVIYNTVDQPSTYPKLLAAARAYALQFDQHSVLMEQSPTSFRLVLANPLPSTFSEPQPDTSPIYRSPTSSP